jgi:hypothetical protein
LVTLTPAATLLVAHDIQKDDPSFSTVKMFLSNSPMVFPSSHSLLYHGLMAWGFSANLFETYLPEVFAFLQWLLPYMVAYNVMVNFPNTLRQACLNMISTYCHYYGDIPENDVFFQTQILDHWIFYPMQLFCFNFGATHVVHHFVTRQPFYLRQLTANRVLPLMKQLGVRHNDLGNHFRGNRWGAEIGEEQRPGDKVKEQ